MTRKFVNYQRVIIKQLMINGSRLDVGGTVQRYLMSGEPKTLKVEVEVNSVFLLLDEDQIVDYNQYHEEKKNEAK